MKHFLFLLLYFSLFGLIVNLYGKAEYKLGYYNSCISIYTAWYTKLGIKDIDRESLKKFCQERTDK